MSELTVQQASRQAAEIAEPPRRPLRLAVIGAGARSEIAAHAVESGDGVIVAVADPSATARERAAAEFGADVMDDSAEAERLREGHFSATSNFGNCILFDGNGIHRGGMVNQGERRCLFIMLAEV